MKPRKKAVILLSGGIDSATTLAIARSRGFACYALSFNYGQRHVSELRTARLMAKTLGAVEHLVMKIDLRVFGGSALTSKIPVPKNRRQIGRGIPNTYVPARNTIFLSLALAYAEVKVATDIFIGANALDYSGYPDCRPEYIRAFQRLANLATKVGVEKQQPFRIHAPLLKLTKAQIIRKALRLGVNLHLTQSCYDPRSNGAACGRCDSCLLRKKGFAEAGLECLIPLPRSN
ncbi:MAG: 7-cyano-7-deazaguanine synthase QueC [Planctomycetota bacterium]